MKIYEKSYLFIVNLKKIETWETERNYIAADSFEEAYKIAETFTDEDSDYIITSIKMKESKYFTSVYYK